MTMGPPVQLYLYTTGVYLRASYTHRLLQEKCLPLVILLHLRAHLLLGVPFNSPLPGNSEFTG